MKMTEARNYLSKLAEGKESQRKKDLAFWNRIMEALEMIPRTPVVDSLAKFCINRRALFTDTIATGCAPEVTFYKTILEETAKYKDLSEEEMLKIVIAANQPKVVVSPVPIPVSVPAQPVPVKPKAPVVAGEVDDVTDMDDDEELDGKANEEGNSEI